MANEKTLNKLANYQMVSDLLGTYLDYHQKEREMMMKYGESGEDKDARIIKEGGINYYADTGERVLDVPIVGEDGKVERFQWTDANGKIMTGTNAEAEVAEAAGGNDFKGYWKLGTMAYPDDSDGAAEVPELFQVKYENKDGKEVTGQGTYDEMQTILKTYPNAQFVKLPTGFTQDKSGSGEQLWAWYTENDEYKFGTIDDAKLSGRPFGKIGTVPKPTNRKMFHQDGIAYYEDTKQPVLTDVTTLTADGAAKGVHFDMKNGNMIYYSKDNPTDLTSVAIPGWSASRTGTNTRIIKHGANYRILDSATNNIIHEGSFPETAGETHADRKQQTKDSISDFATMYNMKNAPEIAELYKLVDADEDITEPDQERFGSILDDLVAKKSDQVKETRRTTQSNYGKFINQGLMDRFGPGQGGTVQSFSIPGADVDFTMSTKRGAEWDPTRASGVLARIKGYQKIAGTNLGQITQDEGGALIADVFVAKHTDYGSVKGGYKLKGNTMTTGVGKDKRETQVTPIDDAFGNKYAYGPNKELFYYDEDNGGVYRKVKGKHAQYTIENGNIVTGNLSKWYMAEVAKYKFID